MAFAGVLLAILLRTASDALANLTRMGSGVSLLVTCIAVAAALSLAGWLVAPKLSGEIDQLRQDLAATWNQITASVHKSKWAGQLF
jgi:predicted PurR-regulated permease PerM